MRLLKNFSHGLSDLSDLAVATDGKTIYVSEDGGNEFADLLKEGQLVFTRTIPQIERDLEAKILELKNYQVRRIKEDQQRLKLSQEFYESQPFFKI
jgi:hypothetical protein